MMKSIASILFLSLHTYVLAAESPQQTHTPTQPTKSIDQQSREGGIPAVYLGEWAEKKEYCDTDGVITISSNGYGGYEFGCSFNKGIQQGDSYVASFTCNENGDDNASTQSFSMTTDGKLVITSEVDNKGTKVNTSNYYFNCKVPPIKN